MNGKYEGADCMSTRLVLKEVSDVWKVPTSSPIDFTIAEFAAAVQKIKLGKAPEPVFICLELPQSHGYVASSFRACATLKCPKSGEELF